MESWVKLGGYFYVQNLLYILHAVKLASTQKIVV